MKETKERLVLTKIEHLKEQLPWTMGLAGLARLVTWESKNVLYDFLEGNVEDTRDVVLVRSYEIFFVLQAFPHLEHARGLSVVSPEFLRDVTQSVNSDAIELILLDCFPYPIEEILPNELVVLIKVW